MKHSKFKTLKKIFAPLLAIPFFFLITSCEEETSVFEFLVPEVSVIAPLQGEKYTKVTISGKNLGNDKDNVHVLFNGMEAKILTLSDNQIITEVPHKARTGKITVIFNNSIISHSTLFTYFIDDTELPYSGTVCNIYGSTTASPNDTLIYEYESNRNNLIFNWSVTEGDIEIIEGQNSEFVIMKFGENFTSGSIHVNTYGHLLCDDIFQISKK